MVRLQLEAAAFGSGSFVINGIAKDIGQGNLAGMFAQASFAPFPCTGILHV
jgi:hypothetical protein